MVMILFTNIYEKIKEFIKNNLKELIIIAVLVALFSIELPFVIYKPGGLVNLNNRINVTDGYETKGEIGMCYVSMLKGKIPFVLLSYIMPNWDLEKSENVTYDGDSVSETLKKDRIQTQESIDNAIISSYKLTDHKLDITGYHNHVIYVLKDAETTIKDYDEIISIDDIEIKSLAEMKKIINSHKENDVLNILVKRGKKEVLTTSKVFKVDNELKIGVSVITTYDYVTNPEVKIKTKESESGPSGGLMMALSIYNKLTKEDITKGKIIAGTGTIDASGNVGEIGGVKYKVLGAIKKHADVFLCPEENYDDAIKALNGNKKLKVIKVSTLEGTIKALKNLD